MTQNTLTYPIISILIITTLLLPGCVYPNTCTYTGTRIDIQTPMRLILDGSQQSLNTSYIKNNVTMTFKDEVGNKIEWTVFVTDCKKETNHNYTVLGFNVKTANQTVIKWKLDRWYGFTLTLTFVNEFVHYLVVHQMVTESYSPDRLTFGEDGIIKGRLKVKDNGDTIVFSLDKKYDGVDVITLKNEYYDGVIRLTTEDWLFKVHFKNLKDC